MSKERKTRYSDLVGGLLLGLVTVGVLSYTAYYLTHTVQADARLVSLPLPVQTVRASVRTLHETIGASGSIQPSMPVTLTAKVVSRVIKVPVDLGAVVKPGDLLVQMDRKLFEADLESARASYYHAQKQLQRMDALMLRHYASEVDLEKARTDAAAARDAMVRAEIDLANTRIVSPVTAVVLEREVNPGEITRLDQNLIQLGVIDPVMMVAQVSEDKIGAVYLGMKAVVGTDAFPGRSFDGSVVKIDSRINDSTRSFAVYIQLANSDLQLKKGVTGYSRLEGKRMVLAIPSTAIMNPVGDRATVFVITKDKRAHMREIRQGLAVAGMTEIFGGLEEGDEVITVGQFNLHDNDVVSENHFAPWNKSGARGS
jgi:membrane fusion protein, multidrug efflux system